MSNQPTSPDDALPYPAKRILVEGTDGSGKST
jgi:hypothetical protein